MTVKSNSLRGGTSATRTPAARVAAISWLVAGMTYLAGEAAAALAYQPTYSYARNYISDLGVPSCGVLFEGRAVCSRLSWLMNADFVLQGILFFAAAIAIMGCTSSRARYALLAFAMLNGVGITLVGLFPESASATVRVHTLGALLSIVFGNATALASAFAFRGLGLPRLHRAASLALPLLATVAFSTLLAARARGTAIIVPDGIWERTSVYTITAWELLTGVCLMVRARYRSAP